MPEMTLPPPAPPRPSNRWTSDTNPRRQNPKGRDLVHNEFDTFVEKPFDEQRKEVDQSWLELAFVLPRKALRLALTGTKKDSGQLQQLVTSAAIAKDKRFPNSEEAFTIRLPASLLQAYSVAIQVAPIPVPASTQIVQAEAQAVPKDIV